MPCDAQYLPVQRAAWATAVGHIVGVILLQQSNVEQQDLI